MTDLVNRLLTARPRHSESLMREAAEEIQRLEHQLDVATTQLARIADIASKHHDKIVITKLGQGDE